MRRAHLCTAIGVALALMTPAAAFADIGPVIKPEGPAKTVTPLAKPPAATPKPKATPAAHEQPAQPTSTTPTHTYTPPATHTQTVTPAPTQHTTPAAATPATVSGG